MVEGAQSQGLLEFEMQTQSGSKPSINLTLRTYFLQRALS